MFVFFSSMYVKLRLFVSVEFIKRLIKKMYRSILFKFYRDSF